MKNAIIIANWKMSLSLQKTLELAKEIKNGFKKIKPKNIELVLCPSFTALSEVNKIIKKEKIHLGAQDVFWEEKGPFTSQISPWMLKELGVEYVIIGHSERRRAIGETDEMVHKKVKAALRDGLKPVICVGEEFEERQNKLKDYVVIRQVSRTLEGIKLRKDDQVIIAYEPVWVIGSGQAVDPEEAEYTNKVIRHRLLDLYPANMISQNFRFIYGGSISSKIIKQFLEQPTIDGVLTGISSLEKTEFLKLLQNAGE